MLKRICVISALLLTPTLQAQNVVTEHTFDDAGSSSAFDAAVGADYTVDFGFDYSTLGIAEAPNSPGTAAATRGLATVVNLTGTATAVNVYTTDTYADPFEMQVDLYYFHDGNTGSTENPLLGINHSGTKTVNLNQSGGTGTPTDVDGYYYTVFGDGDRNGPDHVFQEGGNNTKNESSLPGVAWSDSQSPDDPGREFTDQIFVDALPSSDPAGVVRGAWNTVKMSYVDGFVRLSLNGAEVMSYNDPDDTFTSGKVMLGHEDFFAGANTGNYVIFDNLVITEIVVTAARHWELYK